MGLGTKALGFRAVLDWDWSHREGPLVELRELTPGSTVYLL